MKKKYDETQIGDLSNTHDSFLVEFFGYNFTISSVDKKIYLKAPFARKVCTDKELKLDDNKLKLIFESLDNEFFASFVSDRYSLYDICLRESNCTSGVGFNFVDLWDSNYIDDSLAVEPFTRFWDDASFYETIKLVKKGMFQQQPSYNPISMIGLVVDGEKITSIKSYIRFNTEDVPSVTERTYLIKRIIKSIKPNTAITEYILNMSQKLENLGFEFSFVGTDCYSDESERFKFYFRFRGNNDIDYILNEIIALLSYAGLYNNVYEVLDRNYSGIWGLAISTNTFNDVNGIQLYFYP